jgi:hypothetical protein
MLFAQHPQWWAAVSYEIKSKRFNEKSGYLLRNSVNFEDKKRNKLDLPQDIEALRVYGILTFLSSVKWNDDVSTDGRQLI